MNSSLIIKYKPKELDDINICDYTKELINIYLETKDSLGENINAELEVRFGTKNIGKITKNRFDNTIKYLLANNFDFSDNGKYYLSIKADDIRVEIDNINNIQTYCKTNSLPTEYPTQGYTFTEKTSYLIDDTIQAKVNLDNFDSIICPELDNLDGINIIKTKL